MCNFDCFQLSMLSRKFDLKSLNESENSLCFNCQPLLNLMFVLKSVVV